MSKAKIAKYLLRKVLKKQKTKAQIIKEREAAKLTKADLKKLDLGLPPQHKEYIRGARDAKKTAEANFKHERWALEDIITDLRIKASPGRAADIKRSAKMPTKSKATKVKKSGRSVPSVVGGAAAGSAATYLATRKKKRSPAIKSRISLKKKKVVTGPAGKRMKRKSRKK